jgi:hypothetical protein
VPQQKAEGAVNTVHQAKDVDDLFSHTEQTLMLIFLQTTRWRNSKRFGQLCSPDSASSSTNATVFMAIWLSIWQVDLLMQLIDTRANCAACGALAAFL